MIAIRHHGPATSPVTRSVMRLWADKHDTAGIAKALNLAEPDVCRILHAEQDRRYRERATRLHATD